LVDSHAAVCAELWVSLAAVLRSYAAAHGLGQGAQAQVDGDETHILARHQNKWLDLKREGARVTWMRENGKSGVLELTEAGRLRGTQGEKDLDLAAEAWARELMA
jgi:hypothetical protein